MSDLVTVGFSRSSDTSESYKEEAVTLSDVCNLVGTRHVNVNKSYTHKISIALKSVATIIKDVSTGHWHMADDNGNYDNKWYLNDHLTLENVKLMQGLVIRGTITGTSYHSSKKYCKEIASNRDRFFTKNKIPVMTAKVLLIDSRGTVYGRGVK